MTGTVSVILFRSDSLAVTYSLLIHPFKFRSNNLWFSENKNDFFSFVLIFSIQEVMENFKMACLIAVEIAVHVAKRHAALVWSQRVSAITLAIVVPCGASDTLLVWLLVVW